MNRTQRAIKKQCRLAMNAKKAEKRRALAELRDSIAFYDEGYSEEVKSLSKEEKGLKKWHRDMLKDYTSRNNTLEVAGA